MHYSPTIMLSAFIVRYCSAQAKRRDALARGVEESQRPLGSLANPDSRSRADSRGRRIRQYDCQRTRPQIGTIATAIDAERAT